MEADILIKNGMILTMDENCTIHEKADLAVRDSKILDISPESTIKAHKVINADGKLVMPGLINAHTHAAMVMMRGLADDMPLDIWWQKFIFPIEKKFANPEFIRIGTRLAAIEMIKSGTTAFSDMYFFEEAAAETCKQIGIRAFLGEAVMDFPTPDAQNADETLQLIERLYEKWWNDPIIHLTVAPHAVYSCGKENLLKSKTLADKLDLPLHIHISETVSEVADIRKKEGMSPVEYLEKMGFLGEKVMAVHCACLDQNDMQIIADKKVKVIHCQESNMKLASGNAPIVELARLGVTVGLGTDGAASNNNLDMFDEMDSVAKYHKAIRSDPTVMPAKMVVKMATADGAKAVLRPDLGMLKAGKTADVIIIDLERPHLVPLYNIYSHLVYSAGGSEVDTVIINGKLVMENRDILTIDEDEVFAQARTLAEKIKQEVGND